MAKKSMKKPAKDCKNCGKKTCKGCSKKGC